MQFIDMNDARVCTLADLKKEWREDRAEDPENHAADFKTELLEILMATVNGRNDIEIIGMTPRETDSLIHRLRAQAVK